MSKRINNSEKIKKKYLSKLSIELIRRGISNYQIKSVLDEVALSLTEYIPENEIDSLEGIEQSFGPVKQFCDNMLYYSKEVSFGQLVYTSLIVISFITVLALGIAGFFFYPYYWIIRGGTIGLFGVSATNMGAGFLGTLFGLNMFIWIIYQHIKNRFSKYDIRENAKKGILGLYWFIVLVWIVQAILPYTIFGKVIADMWNQDMEFLVIEGIIRWLFLGIFLITTAVLYTRKYRREKQKNGKDSYIIDNLRVIFIFFVLTGFIIPNPGIGMVVLFLGLVILLLGKITGETWIIGTLAILSQTIILSLRLNHHLHTPVYEAGSHIILGVKLSFYTLLEKGNIYFIMILIVIAILWTIICIIIIRKRKGRILPIFKIPNKKKFLQSLLFLSLIGLATLGSQPQYTFITASHEHYRIPEPYGDVLAFDSAYRIPAKGTIYFSIYTNIDVMYFEDHKVLEGNWSIQWHYVSAYSGTFGNFSTFTYNVSNEISNGEISLNYMIFEVDNPGILDVQYECDLNTFGGILPYYDVKWVSPVPWFPSWLEILIISTCFLSIFFTWEEPTVKKSKVKDKSEPKERM